MSMLTEISWWAVVQIVLIDLLLGGDNAIVIALACRNLPERLRLRGILWGTGGAISARIVLLVFAANLLQLSYVKLIGGVLLFWIAIKLQAESDDSQGDIHGSARLLTAIKTIVIADIAMSIDNVVAVAGAAQHAGGGNQMLLMILGILVSIPIIMWGSTLVLGLIRHFPIIVIIGAAMLGYIALTMIVSDVVVASVIKSQFPYLNATISLLNVKLSLAGLSGAASIVFIALLGRNPHSAPPSSVD
ncbi:TerC family protein [soil metagenome]